MEGPHYAFSGFPNETPLQFHATVAFGRPWSVEPFGPGVLRDSNGNCTKPAPPNRQAHRRQSRHRQTRRRSLALRGCAAVLAQTAWCSTAPTPAFGTTPTPTPRSRCVLQASHTADARIPHSARYAGASHGTEAVQCAVARVVMTIAQDEQFTFNHFFRGLRTSTASSRYTC